MGTKQALARIDLGSTNDLAIKNNNDVSVTEFLSRITTITAEFERVKPSRLYLGSFTKWQKARQQKFAEIMHDFGVGTNGSIAIKPAVLEQTVECLIKSTCIVERDAKIKAESIKKFDFEQLLNYSHCSFKFLVKRDGNELGFRYSNYVNIADVKIFLDVPPNTSMWFVGYLPPNGYCLSSTELHVHSEKDVRIPLD